VELAFATSGDLVDITHTSAIDKIRTWLYGSLPRAAMSPLYLSAPAYHRVLKLTGATANLVGSDDIQTSDVPEALQ